MKKENGEHSRFYKIRQNLPQRGLKWVFKREVESGPIGIIVNTDKNARLPQVVESAEAVGVFDIRTFESRDMYHTFLGKVASKNIVPDVERLPGVQEVTISQHKHEFINHYPSTNQI